MRNPARVALLVVLALLLLLSLGGTLYWALTPSSPGGPGDGVEDASGPGGAGGEEPEPEEGAPWEGAGSTPGTSGGGSTGGTTPGTGGGTPPGGPAGGEAGETPGATGGGRPSPTGPPEDDADLPALEGTGRLFGRVTPRDPGTTLPAVRLSLRWNGSPPEGYRGPGLRNAPAKEDGSFEFVDLAPGSWTVTAEAAGCATREKRGLDVADGAVVGPVELLMVPGGAIAGRVANSGGGGASGLPVRARTGNPARTAGEAVTDVSGEYHLDGLLPGDYTVEVERAPGKTQRVGTLVREGKTARADFPAGSAIAGVLEDPSGSPVADCIVRGYLFGTPGANYRSRETKTDARGAFLLENLEEGEWSLQAQRLGTGAFAAPIGKVVVGAGTASVTLRLPGGEIAGRLFAKSSNKPLTPREVQLSLYHLVPKKGGGLTLGTMAGMAFAEKDGAYRFRGLAEGEYRLAAHPLAGDYKPFEKDLHLSPNQVMDSLDIAMEDLGATGLVQITAKDAAGKPVEGLHCSLKKGNVTTTAFARSPEAGTYEVRLPEGEHVLALWRRDLAGKEVPVAVKEGRTTEVAIVLEARKPK